MMHRAAKAARSLSLASFRRINNNNNNNNYYSISNSYSYSNTTTALSRMTTKLFSTTRLAASEADLKIPVAPTSNHPHTQLSNAQASIIYTETDEAPALATYSLFPVVNKIGALADIDIIPCDISLSGRVLALFPEKLEPNQRVPDNLAYLGELAKIPDANIIKLPNSKSG